MGRGCGLLRHSPSPGYYDHARYAAPPSLESYVQHFWRETWAFDTSVPQEREMLPHPSVHLVFVRGEARVYGVQLGRFTRTLQGNGRIFGVRFWPGAFYPFLGEAVTTLANTFVSADRVFQDVNQAIDGVLDRGDDDRAVVATLTRWLTAQLPDADPFATAARRAVDAIANDRSIIRVGQLAARMATSERTLERLFHRYVGASARWVIKRSRMNEALSRLSRTDGNHDLTELAQSLGYFDHAHFTNDFKKQSGQTPSAYAAPADVS